MMATPSILPPSPMGTTDPRPSSASFSSSSSSLSTNNNDLDQPISPRGAHFSSLIKPSPHFPRSRPRFFRRFRSLCRTLPIFTMKCEIPSPCKIVLPNLNDGTVPVNLSGNKITGTLFGYRKGRVSLSIQETSCCLPSLIVELAVSTQVLMRDMSNGMVRIALECEKSHDHNHKSSKLLDEPLWTMFYNGKKSGYGVKREATDDDLTMMETLRNVSVGAGVLPEKEGTEGEIAFMRANFEHVIGSKDSETLYLLGPELNNGPELTIFFIRL